MKKEFVIIIIIGVFLFYWFQIRPAGIRAGCEKEVLNQRLYATSTSEKESLNWDMNKINEKEREKSRFYYEECLHEHGLKE